MEHLGGCHCGNLRLNLRLSQPPTEVRLRACTCSFCRAHGTRTTSDPSGSVDLWADDWLLVQAYRFASATADYLICRRCGVYVGAVCETEAGTRAVINTNSLRTRGLFTSEAAPVDHEGEPTRERIARRMANWTPATVHR